MLFILWVWTNVIIYNDIYPSLYLKSIFTSPQFLCALSVHFTVPYAAPMVHPKPPRNNLFIVSIVLPLPEYHIVGIIQCTVFSDWFLLFSNMHLRFIYIFPGSSDGKEPACNVGDLGSIPGLGRSPREGNGNPLQYSCLENSMGRGAWRATVHGIAKSWTQLSEHFMSFCGW